MVFFFKPENQFINVGTELRYINHTSYHLTKNKLTWKQEHIWENVLNQKCQEFRFYKQSMFGWVAWISAAGFLWVICSSDLTWSYKMQFTWSGKTALLVVEARFFSLLFSPTTIHVWEHAYSFVLSSKKKKKNLLLFRRITRKLRKRAETVGVSEILNNVSSLFHKQ